MTTQLAPGEIHLWSARLQFPPQLEGALRRTLSQDELERAGRFRFEKDRARFIARRWFLRAVLAGYRGCHARQVRFQYRPNGKPDLAGGEALSFSVSASNDLALCAVACGQELGVDVEFLRPVPEAADIAKHYFSDIERKTVQAASPGQRRQAFFRCWTRKEAYLKGTGDGLSRPLDQFTVTAAAGEPARLVSVEWDRKEHRRWSLYHLEPGDGYVGALAVGGRSGRLVAHRVTGWWG